MQFSFGDDAKTRTKVVERRNAGDIRYEGPYIACDRGDVEIYRSCFYRLMRRMDLQQGQHSESVPTFFQAHSGGRALSRYSIPFRVTAR